MHLLLITYNMVDRFLEQRLASAAALNDPRLAAQKDARLVKADLDDCSVKQCKAFVELMRYLKDATLAMSSERSPSASSYSLADIKRAVVFIRSSTSN